MININELRRLAQAVQGSPRNFHERVNAIHNLHDALPSGVVLELLDRIIALEEKIDAMPQCTQPAPSVTVDLITDYLVSISAHVAHQDDPKAQAEIGELLRMLAAAPEAKP